MTSNFSINRVFEENLEINFTINDGLFNTNNQFFIIQHFAPIQNLNILTSWSHDIIGTPDTNNYFTIDYCWSFDNITWTSWILMPIDYNNFLNPNPSLNIFLKIRYTYTTDSTIQLELKELNIIGERRIDAIFQPVVLIPNTPVIYTNQDTYKVFNVTDYNIYLSSGNINNLKLNFRYTQTQGRKWSEWVPLTPANLIATNFDPIRFCNFQFGFENIGTDNINLFDLELIGEFQNITAGYKTMARLGLKTQCNQLLAGDNNAIACSTCSTPWNPDLNTYNTCNPNNLLKLNDKNLWSPTIKLINDLNNFIGNSNSWKIVYILTDPDKKGTDRILHEHSLTNVIDMKDAFIIVPENQFPTDIIAFSGMDLDLIQSFEIHILKENFKKLFGVEFRPSKHDIIYLCDLNQLWEVEQQFPKKAFMNAEFFYRVLLKKYNKKANRDLSTHTPANNFVDSITKYTTLDGLFKINTDGEIKSGTNNVDINVLNPSQQYNHLSQMTIRKNLHTSVTIEPNEIWNASLTIAKSQYVLPIRSNGLKLIEYNSTDNNLGLGDNRAISFWLNTSQYDQSWDWTLFSNYDYNNNLGYRINIFQGLLTVTINNTPYSIPLLNFTENIWYCFLINIDQRQSKLELAVYTRQNENGQILTDSKFIKFHKMIFDIIPQSFTINENPFIGGINRFDTNGNRNKWYMTNIRLYNQVMNDKQRAKVLNENIIRDSSLTIIVDNAELDNNQLNYPKYGNL